jgi:hypothetical protein
MKPSFLRNLLLAGAIGHGDIVERAESIATGIEDMLGQTSACGTLAGQSKRLHEQVGHFRFA